MNHIEIELRYEILLDHFILEEDKVHRQSKHSEVG